MKNGTLALVVCCAVIGTLCPSASAISSAVVGLYPPVINGNTVEMGVEMRLSITGPEKLVFFALDVSPSDDALTAGGTDYSRFSFELNASTFVGWNEQLAFDDSPFFSVQEHQTFTDPMSRGTYILGTLQVDLTGLPAGQPLTISIAGPETAYGTETEDLLDFEIIPATIGAGEQTVVPPLDIIPEPVTALSAMVGLASLGAYLRRRAG